MAVVTMRQLLESGVHFGHQTRRWNPKMKRFIFTERNGIYIVDLQQTVSYIDRAFEFVRDTVARGGTVLFVGTKKQAQEAVAEQAARVGMPFVNQRWLGGMLTNFQTVNKRLQRLKELEEIDFDDPSGSAFTKKELLIMRREKDKLAKTLGGIRDMSRVPAAVWVVDTNKEHLAVDEARKLGVPVIAILDTNCDPDDVDYAIPGNDDAIRSVTLLTRVIADAVAEGLISRHAAPTGEAEETGAEAEPLAEWERELLAGAAETGAQVQTEPKYPSSETGNIAPRRQGGAEGAADAVPDSGAGQGGPSLPPAAQAASDDLAPDAAAAAAAVDNPVDAIGTTDQSQQQAPAADVPVAEPEQPAKTEKAEKPAKEAKAEKEAKADKPAKEAKAEKPAKAAKADKPAKEAKADKPAKAEKADKPAKAEKAEKPAKEAKADKPAKAEKAEKPAKAEKK